MVICGNDLATASELCSLGYELIFSLITYLFIKNLLYNIIMILYVYGMNLYEKILSLFSKYWFSM